ncbi:MAG TPA: Uma2 family endonuclease [Pirellulales bacterium]|nr:Uma2 family endonuclease [Pirellulales bacterium]
MSTQSQFHTPAEPTLALIPPLESGDCLGRDEFERRYQAMPGLKKAELIDGVVYLGSPVSHAHGTAEARVSVWLGTYAAQTPRVECATNTTVRLDAFNEVQPDALLRLAAGGQSQIAGENQFLEGAPELVAELALSSASRDLHSKLALYRRHAVREYLVWRVLEGELDWFVLDAGAYVRLAADSAGILKSRVFPGLWLDHATLLRGDMAAALAVLQQGLASPEHAALGGP